jgi:hypothetical protein
LYDRYNADIRDEITEGKVNYLGSQDVSVFAIAAGIYRRTKENESLDNIEEYIYSRDVEQQRLYILKISKAYPELNFGILKVIFFAWEKDAGQMYRFLNSLKSEDLIKMVFGFDNYFRINNPGKYFPISADIIQSLNTVDLTQIV